MSEGDIVPRVRATLGDWDKVVNGRAIVSIALARPDRALAYVTTPGIAVAE